MRKFDKALYQQNEIDGSGCLVFIMEDVVSPDEARFLIQTVVAHIERGERGFDEDEKLRVLNEIPAAFLRAFNIEPSA